MERHLNLRIKSLGVKKYKKIKYPNIPTTSSDLYIITPLSFVFSPLREERRDIAIAIVGKPR